MPICKTGQGTDGYRFYCTPDGNRGYVVKFMKNETLHRTDGPARVCLDRYFNIVQEEYYIEGVAIPEDLFCHVYEEPVERLPLYINEDVLDEIAKDKMNNNTIKVKLKPGPGIDDVLEALEVENVW